MRNNVQCQYFTPCVLNYGHIKIKHEIFVLKRNALIKNHIEGSCLAVEQAILLKTKKKMQFFANTSASL